MNIYYTHYTLFENVISSWTTPTTAQNTTQPVNVVVGLISDWLTMWAVLTVGRYRRKIENTSRIPLLCGAGAQQWQRVLRNWIHVTKVMAFYAWKIRLMAIHTRSMAYWKPSCAVSYVRLSDGCFAISLRREPITMSPAYFSSYSYTTRYARLQHVAATNAANCNVCYSIIGCMAGRHIFASALLIMQGLE